MKYLHLKFLNILDAFKHEIITDEEKKQLLIDINLTSEIYLAKIRENDPQCIWIGAKAGNIVRICRNAIVYRLVIGIVNNKIVSSTSPSYIGPKYSRPKISISQREAAKVDDLSNKTKIKVKNKSKKKTNK